MCLYLGCFNAMFCYVLVFVLFDVMSFFKYAYPIVCPSLYVYVVLLVLFLILVALCKLLDHYGWLYLCCFHAVLLLGCIV